MDLRRIFGLIVLWVFLLPPNGPYVRSQESSKDRFGGDSRIKGKATGYFHMGNVGGRDFLISPDGNGYFALGVNHINTLGESQVLSSSKKEGSQAQEILSNLERWNMNNCGYGCPDYLKDQIPFMVSIRFLSNGHYLPKADFGFEDIFEARFIEGCEQKIKTVTERHRQNPYLIGYYWTDTPRWDIQISRDRHGMDWVAYLKNLPAQSKGKQRFVEFLRSRYPTIGDFNRAYKVYFTSFEALLDARFDHLDKDDPVITEDDELFLNLIAEHLYGTLHRLMKRYDPNHLVFGDKYLLGDHPKGVLKVASKYVDAIAIQPGPTKGPGPGPGEDELHYDRTSLDRINRITGKPIIICDHQTSFFTERYPVTLWHQLPTQEASAQAHRAFLMECIKSDYVIGYQRCQYVDKYDASRGLLKQGVLKENGTPYDVFAEHLATNNKNALESIFKNGE